MRAWDETEDALRRQAETRAEAHEETLRDLDEHGIDLDPQAERTGAGGEPAGDDDGERARRTGTATSSTRATTRTRTRTPARASGRSSASSGAGAVGTALGVALEPRRAGRSAPSRRATRRRRERFRERVPGVRAFAEPNALVDDVELVILAVPDDVVETLAASLRLYAGQAMVHTSGLLGAEVLAPALAAGTQAGAFHPLVAFADLDRALAALRARRSRSRATTSWPHTSRTWPRRSAAVPVRLAPGSKAAYHAAAVLSAGGVVALLDAIREVAAAVGLDEAGALRIYLPLLEQTVANARRPSGSRAR